MRRGHPRARSRSTGCNFQTPGKCVRPQSCMIRHKGPIGLGRALPICWLIWLAALGCHSTQPPLAANSVVVARDAGATAIGPSRDLTQDESAGGHTLRKHVGQTDEQLRDRLGEEGNISAASTWSDRATAEHTVGLALEQNRDRINRWLNRSGRHPNLVLDYDGNQAHPIGRSLRRGTDRAEACAHATIVLKWAGSYDYYVLTSYPECR
jgi:Bacterial CdiA-CT RNAse A domain